MGKSTSWYPSLSVDSIGAGVVSHAGSVLLLRTAEKSGLTTALPRALEPWRKPMTSHDPGKIIADLTMAPALGGDCLADIALPWPMSRCRGKTSLGWYPIPPSLDRLPHWPLTL